MSHWIRCYRLEQGKWPSTVRLEFGSNIRGSASFVERSSREVDFIRMCEQLGLVLRPPRRYLDVAEDDLARYPFHYLAVDSDDTIQADQFLDPSTRCPGGPGMKRCSTGVVQNKPIALAGHRPAKDMVALSGTSPGQMYVISRQLRHALIEIKASGAAYLPIGHTDEFVQMRITTMAEAPPDVRSGHGNAPLSNVWRALLV
jgi:hypothetical protein